MNQGLLAAVLFKRKELERANSRLEESKMERDRLAYEVNAAYLAWRAADAGEPGE